MYSFAHAHPHTHTRTNAQTQTHLNPLHNSKCFGFFFFTVPSWQQTQMVRFVPGAVEGKKLISCLGFAHTLTHKNTRHDTPSCVDDSDSSPRPRCVQRVGEN